MSAGADGIYCLSRSSRTKRTYIEPDETSSLKHGEKPVDASSARPFAHLREEASLTPDPIKVTQQLPVELRHNFAASFVIYQLSNALPLTALASDVVTTMKAVPKMRSISRLMNDYVFGHCFSPIVDGDNVQLFLDHCLVHLSSPFHTGRDEEGYVATAGLAMVG